MERLVPHVQHYAWGSETALPELLGLEPDGRPWAELWVGDHPRLPSTVVSTGEPLDAGLPFLLKILAAAAPLSIQTHPSLEQARIGFERENDAGIPIDAPHRIYRDANHKPELICALTPFDALIGFRPPSETCAAFADVAAFAPIADRLIPDRAGDEAAALRSTVRWILGLDRADAAELVGDLASDIELVAHLQATSPGDPGALVALLLNRIELQPGDAVLLGAGNVHAYLSGMGVEIMANSDNVVRGGLTAKHIDVDELVAIASFEPSAPETQHAFGVVHRFATPGVGFELTRMEMAGERVIDPATDEVVLVTSGRVRVRSVDANGDLDIDLAPGEAAFVGAGTVYALSGDGVAWRAGSGS